MATMTSEALLANLAASNLLSAEQLSRVQTLYGAQGGGMAPQEILQRLIHRGLLTRWQAKRLLSGSQTFFLSQYKLIDQLGQGGMGAVFKAEHGTLGRVVAIKVMHTRFVKDSGAVARFRQEIQAAAALSHPNIVHAYDAGCWNNTHFLVMEYVQGEDFDSILKREGALPIGAACEYVRQAAEGLQHAHEQGMTHRDIKPANLLLTATADQELPLVKILDMGLARLSTGTGDEGGITHTGQVIGTPDYISPEQAMDTKRADIRSDIYSLGCTLFRMISGKIPFGGTSVMEKLMARAMADPPPIRTLKPEVPAELEAILMRMLAREPGQRYQTPGDVAAALAPFSRRLLMYGCGTLKTAEAGAGQALNAAGFTPGAGLADSQVASVSPENASLEDFLRQLATQAQDEQVDRGTDVSARVTQAVGIKPSAAALPGVSRQLQSTIHRRDAAGRKTTRLLLAGVGVLALLGIAGWGWQRMGQTSVVVQWDEADREQGELEIDGRKFKPPRTGELVFAGDPGPRKLRLTRKGYVPIEVAWTLQRGESKVYVPEWQPTRSTRRGQELRELQSEVEKLTADAARDPAVVGKLSAQIRAYSNQHPGTAAALAAARLRRQLPAPADALRPERIDPYELNHLGRIHSGGSEAELVAILGDSRFTHESRARCVAFQPKGKLVATGGDDKVIRFWDVTTGQESRAPLLCNDRVISLDISADGTQLYAASVSEISLWSLVSGKQIAKRPRSKTERMAISPDGKLWAMGKESGSIELLDFDQLQPLQTLSAHREKITGLAFRGDGTRLAASSQDGTASVWDVVSGKQLHSIRFPKNRIRSVAFPRSGEILALGCDHNSVRLWDSNTGKELQNLSGHTGQVEAVAQGSHSGFLASGDGNGRIVLWNREEQLPRYTWGGTGVGYANVTALAFSPDDQLLAATLAPGSVRLFHTATGEEVAPKRGNHGPVDQLVPTTDGKQLYACGLDGVLRVWDLTMGEEAEPFPGLPYSVSGVEFSPDGARIAIAYRNRKIGFWDLPACSLHRVIEAGFSDPLPRMDVGPLGDLVAFRSPDEKVQLWEVETAILRNELPHASKIKCFQFTPDGRMLAVAEERSRLIRVWDVETAQERRTLGPFPDQVWRMQFHPDGKNLAVHFGGQLKLFDARSGNSSTLLVDAPGSVWGMNFSADGGLLAAGYKEGVVRVWEAKTGTLLETLRLSPSTLNFTHLRDVCFTPDGRHIAASLWNGTVPVVRLSDRERPATSTQAETE